MLLVATVAVASGYFRFKGEFPIQIDLFIATHFNDGGIMASYNTSTK